MRWIVVIAVVLLAGCNAATPRDVMMTFSSSVGKEEILVIVDELSVAEKTEVTYRFDVDDGGVADACVVPGPRGRDWHEERTLSTESNGTFVIEDPVEGIACVWGEMEGTSSLSIREGAWEFVARVHSCPALDCRFQWGIAGATRKASMVITTPASG